MVVAARPAARGAGASRKSAPKRKQRKAAQSLKKELRERKHAGKGRVAASGATRRGEENAMVAASNKQASECGAASGAQRVKIRVQGLFGCRHWTHPDDKDSFEKKTKEFRSRFEGLPDTLRNKKRYNGAIKEMLSAEFNPGCERGSRGLFAPKSREARVSPVSLGVVAASSGSHRGICAASGASLLPASGGGHRREPEPQPELPASGGVTSAFLKSRLEAAFKPLHKVEMRTPSEGPAAAFIKQEDSAIAYLQAKRAEGSEKDIHWLPQEAADWLYEATHYAMPLLQTLLGTHRAFNSKGQYIDEDGEPASGGQLAAFWGTELGSRRDRALIAYDTDVDFQVFVTPCSSFDEVWAAATPIFESLDLRCSVTSPGKYYRLSPRFPLTYNSWVEFLP